MVEQQQQQGQHYSPGVLVGNYCERLLLRQQNSGDEMKTEQNLPRTTLTTASAEHFSAPSREAVLAAASAANDARWASVVNAEGRGAAEALFGVRDLKSEEERKKRMEGEAREREERERRAAAEAQQRRQRQRERERRLPRSSSPSPFPPREQMSFGAPVAQRPSFKPRGEATATFDESLAQMSLRR